MTRSLTWTLAASAALAIALSFSPIGATPPPDVMNAAPEAPKEPAPAPLTGEEVYNKTCAKCHGDTGAADTKFAKKLIEKGHAVSNLITSKLTVDEIFEVTSKGREGTKMKGYAKRFDEAQLKAVSEYVKRFQQ